MARECFGLGQNDILAGSMVFPKAKLPEYDKLCGNKTEFGGGRIS